MKEEVIGLRGIHKFYGEGDARLHVLKGIDASVREGEFVAIVGASGSGKTTLLNILGCLDRPTEGQYLLNGEDVSRFSDDRLSEIRNRRLGFVFQSFNLIPQLSVLENVEVPLFYSRMPRAARLAKSRELIDAVGLGPRLHHRPAQLSGGECQRVAIARALVNDPVLLLADEPTGNLDTRTGAEILALIRDLHAQGRTILLITHDPGVAAQAERRIRIGDGRILEEVEAA
ncbi:MAG: ABC transporter ATP-binding protein [Planctomycetes bacterium]|nr:ABC transporter ATP-binding protein [Planctomycetota bacterium]MBI3848616.1 ABC transporter ATP-binding protein [Planctomycetota bacterium]